MTILKTPAFTLTILASLTVSLPGSAYADVVRLSYIWNHSFWGIGGLLADPPPPGFNDAFFSRTPISASFEYERGSTGGVSDQDQPTQYEFFNLRRISIHFSSSSYELETDGDSFGTITATEQEGKVRWTGILTGHVSGPIVQSLAPRSIHFGTEVEGAYTGFPSIQQFRSYPMGFGVEFETSQGNNIIVSFSTVSAVPDLPTWLATLAGSVLIAGNTYRRKRLECGAYNAGA